MQQDALILRLVSKDYRDEVDSMFKFGKIKLDDEKMPPEAIQFLLSKNIANLEVVEFLKEPATHPIFKFPYIQRLKIEMNREIAPINFHNVIRECSRYLKILNLQL